MSPDVYKKLQKAQDDLQKKKYSKALKRLKDMLSDVKDNKYEYAVVLQNIAYVYLDQGKYKPAAPYLKQALALNSLPSYVQDNTTLTLAQVYTSIDKYKQSIDILRPWIDKQLQKLRKFKQQGKKKAAKQLQQQLPRAYVAAASDYGQLKQYKKAIPYIKKAINLADTPHQSWYQLWLASEYQIKDYKEAANVLVKMLSLWPEKKQYWKQLAQTYLQLHEDKNALSTYAVAYQHGALTDEQDFITLAQLYILGNDPYQGAKILQKGLKDGKIKPTKQNLQLLASAWSSAQETKKAIHTLGRVAAKAKNGEIYLRQAALYQNQQEWSKVVDAAHDALHKGGLKHPGKAYMLIGEANAQAKKYRQAIEAFQQAAKYHETKNNASQWIKYVHGLASR
jgi:tetratricopeptide (TPR) repeat protein